VKAKALEANSADQKTTKSARAAVEDVAEDDGEEVPVLLNPEYPNLQSILDKSDAIIHVLDARDPLAFRSSHLEKLLEKKKILLVLNKIGTPHDKSCFTKR
jgi:nuclear GTP-binding protein